ncbi:hypothetical protein HYALB_00006131 [Hymenoscyphus albidus]|uniref:Epidermal growth factor receptor-like transmembrane-juxtamembrane segment domain-containing protein n=1 Tax=Hymenoscyphus albidus TaxID=595503 RepID=A0A9N9LLJ3_9HELO|nr:hypothetical protein HYALB_00006131 [Hymenoscyphus albidus]
MTLLLPTALPLVARSSECTTGQQCDGCQASGCSDSATSTIASSTTSEEPVRTIITLNTIPQPTGPSTSTTTVINSRIRAEAMSSTASPSQTPKATPPNNTPIIVGIVCGIVGCSVISVLIWFLWRRKMQKKTRITSTASSFGGGKDGKDFELARQSSLYENRHLQPEDGRGAYTQAQRARSLSQGSNNPGSAIGSRPATPVPPAETEEKQTVPLPKAQYPAYHPLPGRSPEIPAWRNVETPYTPVTPMTPMHHSSQQTRHPAYHVHQLSQHPAFRAGNSPPRPAPPTWAHPAFRPEGTAHQLDSTPIIPQNELDGFSFVPRSPRIESLRNESLGASRPEPLRLKHSSTELPAADVPRLFSNSNTHSEPNMKSRYETPSEPCSQASSPATPFPQIRNARSHNVLSGDNSARTGISTYTIPIGLGVIDGSPTIGVNPFSLPLQGREITSAPKEESKSKKEEKKRSKSPPPVLKSNMNDRDDHVLSWDSYGAGQLSGIGPSSSISSERSRRQREIEQGIIARDREGRAAIKEGKKGGGKAWMSQERGSYGEIPETPLSTYTESWMERESWALR